MIRLRAKTKNFIEILNLIKLTGKDSTGSSSDLMFGCMLVSDEDNIKIEVLSSNGVAMAKLIYYNIKVEEPGKLAIGDIQEFLSCLARFNSEDEIVVQATENKIEILREKPKKKITLNFIFEEHIDEYVKGENASKNIKVEENNVKIGEKDLNVKVTITAEEIQEVLKDAEIKNIERKFKFNVEEDKLNCIVGDEQKTKVQTEIIPKLKEGVCSCKYMAGIDAIFSNLSGEVKLFLDTDSPLCVQKRTDDFYIFYLISPVVDIDD